MLAVVCTLCDIFSLKYTEGSEQYIQFLHGKHSATSESEVTAFTGNLSCLYVYGFLLVRKTFLSHAFDACIIEPKWREIFISGFVRK